MAEVKRYHSDVPDWRKTRVTKSGDLIGVELEVHNNSGKEVTADSLDTFKPNKKYPAPIAENDSSLDPDNGVEIICPPLPIEEATSSTGYIGILMETLRKAGVVANPTTNYGMHINVNMAGWSSEEKLAVQYLCNRFAKTGKLFGRRATGFGSYIPVFKLKYHFGGEHMVSISTWPGGKHAAAHIRASTDRTLGGGVDGIVIEVRLAKSTLDITDLKVMVDYIYALRNWVRIAPRHTIACCFLDYLLYHSKHVNALESGPLEQMFKYWCRKNAPGIYALLQQADMPELQSKPNRLSVMQGLTKGVRLHNSLNNVGIYVDTDATGPEQAQRLSTVLSKGIKLEGQLASDGKIYASSLRSAD
jgi:hypothetical protein